MGLITETRSRQPGTQDSPALGTWELGLQVCITTPGFMALSLPSVCRGTQGQFLGLFCIWQRTVPSTHFRFSTFTEGNGELASKTMRSSKSPVSKGKTHITLDRKPCTVLIDRGGCGVKELTACPQTQMIAVGICSDLLSIAVVNAMAKSNLGRKGFIWLTHPNQPIMKKSE